MNQDRSYRKAFYLALFLHLSLGLLLLIESKNRQPTLNLAKNESSQHLNVEIPHSQEIVKAVSVDSQEVMKTVNRLKEARNNQLKAEQTRQQALQREAELARKARALEQKHLAQLKEEAQRLALERKKQIEEEQKNLKQLALQKAQELKRLEALKEKQQQLQKKQLEEASKMAQLKKKQMEENLKAEKEAAQKAKEELVAKERAKEEAQKEKEALAQAEKAKAIQAQKNQEAALQRAEEAAKKAQLAGVVDKYKALIVNAIGRQWILPENVNKSLSSQFRIRLAPDGAVLEVSLIRSSGDALLDRSAQTAIYKASPLPVPEDPETFNLFRDISLTVRPENVRG